MTDTRTADHSPPTTPTPSAHTCRDVPRRQHASGPARRNLAAAREFQGKLADAGLAGLAYATEYGGAGLTADHERIWRAGASELPVDDERVRHQPRHVPAGAQRVRHRRAEAPLHARQHRRPARCGARCSPSPAPAPTSPACRRRPSATATSGSSTARRCGPRSPTSPTTASSSPAPIPSSPSTPASRCSSSTSTAPGVEIRPIHQIDGGRHFNEVFFTDVRIPADDLIGEYNNGWRQATAMLMYERVAIGSTGAGRSTSRCIELLRQGRRRRTGGSNDPVVRDQLMRDLLHGDHQVARRDADPRRAQGRQGAGPGRLARQARRLDHRLALPRDRDGDRRPRQPGVGSRRRRRPRRSGTLQTIVVSSFSRASPAAPTRSSATSSATGCSDSPATSPSTPRSRSRTSRSAPSEPIEPTAPVRSADPGVEPQLGRQSAHLVFELAHSFGQEVDLRLRLFLERADHRLDRAETAHVHRCALLEPPPGAIGDTRPLGGSPPRQTQSNAPEPDLISARPVAHSATLLIRHSLSVFRLPRRVETRRLEGVRPEPLKSRYRTGAHSRWPCFGRRRPSGP